MKDGLKKPWKKNLYENSGYPDNYTDSSFLRELKKNIHKQDITYREAILGAGKVTEKLCVVTLFSVIFVYLYNEWMEPEAIFVQTSIAVCLCYVYYMMSHRSIPFHKAVAKDSKRVVTFLVFGYILSPVLKTLTDTISTDTIYATAAFMMLVHLAFYDYKIPAAIISSSLSLNAAIFSSICLASRLSTSFHAFVLLTISAECFVLYPYFTHAVVEITFVFIFFSTLLTCLLVANVSFIMSFLFLVTSLFINVICPVLFVHWQKYKENIYGPWDEAIIKYTNS